MKLLRWSLCSFAAVVLLSFFSAFAGAQNYQYATLDVPGAKATIATGINRGNVVVGAYIDQANQTHGFRYQGGKFSTIDVPKATMTTAGGLNDAGDVVGTYSLPGTPAQPANSHGFLLHKGTFKTIDYPRAQFTGLGGINNHGVIVGAYGSAHGLIYRSGKFTTSDAPTNSSPDTVLNAISDSGAIVGQVFSGDNWRGFLKTGNDLDFLEPYLATDNIVAGINGHGDVVGCYNGGQGFIAYNPEAGEKTENSEPFPTLHPLSFPNSHGGCVTGINYARVIVGFYYDASFVQHGFLAIPH